MLISVDITHNNIYKLRFKRFERINLLSKRVILYEIFSMDYFGDRATLPYFVILLINANFRHTAGRLRKRKNGLGPKESAKSGNII